MWISFIRTISYFGYSKRLSLFILAISLESLESLESLSHLKVNDYQQ